MTNETTSASIITDYNNLITQVKAVKSSVNPHFKNRFAPLDAWLDEVHRLTGPNNFMFTESIRVATSGDDIYQVHRAQLDHVSGRTWYSEYFISLIDKPQAMGAACTYARRYNIQTLLTCTGEDDDDGNAAQSVTTETRTVQMSTRKKLA
jgi:ERF superfamily